jgi:hypothetical protein
MIATHRPTAEVAIPRNETHMNLVIYYVLEVTVTTACQDAVPQAVETIVVASSGSNCSLPGRLHTLQ